MYCRVHRLLTRRGLVRGDGVIPLRPLRGLVSTRPSAQTVATASSVDAAGVALWLLRGLVYDGNTPTVWPGLRRGVAHQHGGRRGRGPGDVGAPPRPLIGLVCGGHVSLPALCISPVAANALQAIAVALFTDTTGVPDSIPVAVPIAVRNGSALARPSA